MTRRRRLISLTLFFAFLMGCAIPFLFSIREWDELFLIGMKTTRNLVDSSLSTGIAWFPFTPAVHLTATPIPRLSSRVSRTLTATGTPAPSDMYTPSRTRSPFVSATPKRGSDDDLAAPGLPSQTAVVVASRTPRLTFTPRSTPTGTSVSQTSTPVPSTTIIPSGTHIPTVTPRPSSTATRPPNSPTTQPTRTPTPRPSRTPTPRPTNTTAPTPSNTPEPLPTPTTVPPDTATAEPPATPTELPSDTDTPEPATAPPQDTDTPEPPTAPPRDTDTPEPPTESLPTEPSTQLVTLPGQRPLGPGR